MPTYDYKCLDCGDIFEHFQSMKDDPLEKCLCDKKGDVKRQISNGSGIIFKGSGFYVTDYKKKDSSSSSTPEQTNKTPSKS
ncbi:MAG: FmdB family zinc ribbon protein [Spirochaetota bacterium]